MVKIKSVKKFVSGIKNPEETPKEWTLRSHFSFDENENPLEEILFLDKNRIESRTTFKYNEQQRMIEKASYLEDDEFAEKYKYEFKDIEDDNPSKIIIEYADGSSSIKTISKEENTYLINIVDDEGDDEGKEIKVFDENNNLIEHTIIDEEGVVQEKVIHSFKDELLIKKEEYGFDNELISVTHYKYDENENQIEEKSFSEDGNLKHQRYSKYENNLLVEDYISDVKAIYYYDDNRRRIRTEMVDAGGNKLSFNEYEYNEHGQISQQISYQMGDRFALEPNVYGRLKSQYLITRYEYEYFD
jgi:hypothetical protein